MPDTSLQTLLAVAVGGALGALARYGLVVLGDRLASQGALGSSVWASPHWVILFVNVLGCALLGLIAAWLMTRPQDAALAPHLQMFLTVGLLGAFTTYSTFAIDAARLVHAGKPGEAALYVALSVVLGLAAGAGAYFGAHKLLS